MAGGGRGAGWQTRRIIRAGVREAGLKTDRKKQLLICQKTNKDGSKSKLVCTCYTSRQSLAHTPKMRDRKRERGKQLCDGQTLNNLNNFKGQMQGLKTSGLT